MDQPRWGSAADGAAGRALCAFSSGDDAAAYVALETSASEESATAGSDGGAVDSGEEGEVGGAPGGGAADHTPVGRYFLPQGGDAARAGGAKCFSCGQTGHMSRDCPAKAALPCFLCGGTDHQRAECPDDVCFNCGCVGHISRECREPRRRRPAPTDECMRCGELGHLRRECSLAWRRYVLCVPLAGPGALTDAALARALRPIARACYFCASPTHFGDDCPLRLDTAERTAFRRPDAHVLSLAGLTDAAQEARGDAPPRTKRSGAHEPDMSAADRRALEHHERALGHAGPAHGGPYRGARRGGGHRGGHRQTYPNMSYRRADV